MFEFIRTHKRLMHVLLLLLIVPSFAFFGLEGYTQFRDRSGGVATVSGKPISQQEWENAQREQMDRLRQIFGQQFDQKMFDTPEARREVLDGLITQRVLQAEAQRHQLAVSDAAIQQTILDVPGLLNAEGKFDAERYKSLLSAQGMTPAMFEARLRQDLALQRLSAAISGTAIVPKTVAARISEISEQEREVRAIVFRSADFTAKVKVSDAMLKEFYDKNGSRFDVPEQVKAEYLVLDGAAVASLVTVSDAGVEAHYQQNKKLYALEEQRRASHVLIAIEPNASDADRAAAKAKAEKLLEQVRKNPAEFAVIARKNSQDPGSAERGGDLGFFGRGMMVKPFEDAVFNLKQGEISGVVTSDFGLHIIELTDIKAGVQRSLEDVRAEITAEIRKQQTERKFREVAEVFGNIVYEQADSLRPAAEKLKLQVQVVSGLTRNPNPMIASTSPANQPKFLSALFSDHVLKEKRNTDVIEVAPNTLIAGRIVEHKPVTRKPFEEVKELIREAVVQHEAAALAKKTGEAKLAAVMSSADAGGFDAPVVISRTNAPGFSAAALTALMKADVSKLPAYVGVDVDRAGYAVYRINKVSQPQNADAARRDIDRKQLASVLAQREMASYIESLKKKAKVEIHTSFDKVVSEGGVQ